MDCNQAGPEAGGVLELREEPEGDTGAGAATADADAAAAASFVGCHSRSWHTEHFVLQVVLGEVEVVGCSTEDYTGLPLGAGDVELVDALLQLPSKPSSLVVQVEEVEDLEAKEAVAGCNWAEEEMDFCSLSITTPQTLVNINLSDLYNRDSRHLTNKVCYSLRNECPRLFFLDV
jgi:hypothetical protein